MTVSSRIYQNTGIYFSLKKGSAAAVVFGDDVKKVTQGSEDKSSEDVTFGEVALSGQNYTWTVTAISSDDTGSFEQFLHSNIGQSVIAEVGFWGNLTPSVAHYHETLPVTITKRPLREKEAGTEATGMEFEYELVGTGDVTRVTS